MSRTTALSSLSHTDKLLVACLYCSLFEVLEPAEAWRRFGETVTFDEAEKAATCRRCDAKSEFMKVRPATDLDLERIAHPGRHLVRSGRRNVGGPKWP